MKSSLVDCKITWEGFLTLRDVYIAGSVDYRARVEFECLEKVLKLKDRFPVLETHVRVWKSLDFLGSTRSC